MKTPFWAQYIPDHTIQAICWTLVHSLWIGMVTALLAGAVIMFTRKSKANLRYRLLCGTLVLFVAAIGITFYTQLQTVKDSQVQVINIPAIPAVNTPGNTVKYTVAAHSTIPDRFIGLIKQNTDLIFVVWLLLFMLKSLKMAGGLLYIQRIKTYRVHNIGEELQHRVDLFARQIGIGRAVRLMQSELVKVPVAVGWLKPVILLPMGIILQLPAEQLESILWHELAHIRRRDYLVNILQGLVETVFFFNPGLLWLSSLIRAEREACCDDMVLSRMNRKANYLEALLALGNDNYGQPKLAMGIGSGNQLRDRMRRMVSQENKRLSVVEKVVLVTGLVLLSAFTSMPKTTQATVQHLVNFVADKTASAVRFRAFIGNRRKEPPVLLKSIDTIRFKKDTAIHFVSVLFKYSDADMANNDIAAKDASGKIYHLIVSDDKLVSMEINGVKVNNDDLQHYDYMLRNIQKELLVKKRMRGQGGFRLKADDKGDMISSKFKADSIRFDGEKLSDARNSKMQNLIERYRKDSTSYAAQQQRVLNVIANLVSDKVVPDAASVKWFGLSNTEFIVNGQKQPDEMQQRYKTKYGVYENYGLYYGPVKMNGTGVFIGDGDGERRHADEFSRQKKDEWMAERRSDMISAQKARQEEQMIKQQIQMERMKQEHRSSDQELKIQQKNVEWLKQQAPPKSNIDLQSVITGVIADLVSANVISDKSDLLNFNLTNSALIVNGKKQSEELHERLKAKYLQQSDYPNAGITADPRYGLYYHGNGKMALGIMKTSQDDNHTSVN